MQKRIISITEEMNKMKALYGQLEGHLAESQHWLKQIIDAQENNKEEAKESELVGDTDC